MRLTPRHALGIGLMILGINGHFEFVDEHGPFKMEMLGWWFHTPLVVFGGCLIVFSKIDTTH